MSDYIRDIFNDIMPVITSKDEYSEDVIAYYREVHDTTFPPKLAFFLKKMYELTKNKVSFKAIFKSPRGGGKSKMASAYEFACWYMLDAEAVNCGGSEEQARIVFEYCKAYTDRDRDARAVAPEKYTLSDRMSKIGPKPQPLLQSVPASPKSIRGKHPGGETRTAGILVMDEMVEMEDAIVIDALGMLRGARPPILICLSTFHKMFGKFQEFWDDDDNDFIKFDWDTFDVCVRCEDDCKNCVKEIEEYYCKVICNCHLDYDREPKTLPIWRAYTYVKEPNTGEMIKQPGDIGTICPECGGRVDHKARFAENGWITIKEIRDAWKLYDKERFEVDIMGWRPSGSGLVIDPNALHQCITRGLSFDKRAYIRCGIDWGARGMSALVLVQKFGDGKCEIFDAWHKEAPKQEDIYNQLILWRRKYGLNDVYADMSHPFENDHIKHKLGMNLREVNFNTQKMAGIGVIRNYVEKRMLFIDERHMVLVKQLKNWHKDAAGNIKKINDHYCDSLICAMVAEVGASELISAYDKRGGYIQDKEIDYEREFFSGYGYDMEYGADEYSGNLDDDYLGRSFGDIEEYGY